MSYEEAVLKSWTSPLTRSSGLPSVLLMVYDRFWGTPSWHTLCGSGEMRTLTSSSKDCTQMLAIRESSVFQIVDGSSARLGPGPERSHIPDLRYTVSRETIYIPDTPWDCHRTADQLGLFQGSIDRHIFQSHGVFEYVGAWVSGPVVPILRYGGCFSCCRHPGTSQRCSGCPINGWRCLCMEF